MSAPRVYLDWNATTPPRTEVLDAMRDVAGRAWANPASTHTDGRAARAVVEDARAAIGALYATDPRDVVFTSGGTEANNLAIRSAFAAPPSSDPPWLLTSRLEHPSVTRVAEALEKEGRARLRWIGILPSGTIDLADLERALAELAAILVTVQAVNHETGIVQPVADVIGLARAKKARVHVDAVQAWGKVAVPQGADTASLGAHKMRGPKGIGALFTRPGARLVPLLVGGAQEKGIRPGTVDPALAAGAGVAARCVDIARFDGVRARRDALEKELLALNEGGAAPRVAGDVSKRAPHVSTTLWPGWVSAELVAALDLEGVSVSAGSACSAGTIEPSPVIGAMLGQDVASCAVRASFGETTTDEDVRAAVAAFRRVLSRTPRARRS